MSRIFIAAAFVALPALAAPVYKHIGPDGTVSYSDVPATGAATVQGDARSKPPGFEDNPVTAAIMVSTHGIIVESIYRFCRDAVPDTALSVKAARDRWVEQHTSLHAKAKTILRDKLTMAELRNIAAQTEQDNEKVLGQLRQAPYAEKKRICEDAPAKFTAAEMNVAGHPALVRTIMDFKLGR